MYHLKSLTSSKFITFIHVQQTSAEQIKVLMCKQTSLKKLKISQVGQY